MAKKMINISAVINDKLKVVAPTYPIVAENGVKFPFIIYKTHIEPDLTKDGIYCAEWDYNVNIKIVHDTYDKTLLLCDAVIYRLLELETDDFDINILSIDEDFQDDAYIKEIQVRITK